MFKSDVKQIRDKRRLVTWLLIGCYYSQGCTWCFLYYTFYTNDLIFQFTPKLFRKIEKIVPKNCLIFGRYFYCATFRKKKTIISVFKNQSIKLIINKSIIGLFKHKGSRVKAKIAIQQPSLSINQSINQQTYQ